MRQCPSCLTFDRFGFRDRDWVAWLDGDVCDATRTDVVRYLQRWVCPDTRASRCAALSGFYRWARALGVIPRSPVEMVEVHGRGLPNPNPIPDDVLIAALVNAGPTERDAVILGRFAGLRASEIAAVHRRDLDQRPDHLRVVGKGSKIRYVPVHDEVRRLVESVAGYVFPGRGHPERHWTASPCRRCYPRRGRVTVCAMRLRRACTRHVMTGRWCKTRWAMRRWTPRADTY